MHNGFYDYSKAKYCGRHGKIIITCPKHGGFKQMPNSHLNGRGCPLCKTSHLERFIDGELKKNNILYIYQYHNKNVFGKQSLDFYIQSKKIAKECQGEQHFIANYYKSKGIDFAEDHLKYVQELDERKRTLCKENGIELVYFLDKMFLKYIDCDNKCFTTEDELIEYINTK